MRRALLLLLLCGLMLTSCSRDPVSHMAENQSGGSIPAPAASELPRKKELSTLWFRFGSEPFLAAEAREISTASPSDTAYALLQALLAGPGAASDLGALFPQGTRVIAVSQSGRIMFVTLSRHIMNGYADEPDNWRDDPRWAIEVPLRRTLAMQSIVATLTDNCDVDTVVILVEQTETVTDSLRLRQHYYTLDGDMTLAAPLLRDESLLLSPARTAQIILQAWQESDWARLYRYIARTDPATAALRPAEDEFIQQMAALPHLIRCTAEGGSLSADGRTAVFTLSGAWLVNGTEQPFTGLPFKLTLEKGIWRVGLSQLLGREALP